MTRRFIQIMAVTITAIGSASASSLPSCSLFSGQTLTQLLSQSCVVGDKLFSNFDSTDPASITDTVTFNYLSPLNNDPGIEFTGLSAAAGQTVLFNVSYTVEVLPKNAFAIQMPELSLPQLSFNGSGGSISGTEKICEKGAGDAETCVGDGGSLYTIPVLASSPAVSFSNSVKVPITLTVDVATDLTLNGGSGGTSAGRIDERFAQVATPEPATFALLGCGLVLISLFERKKLPRSLRA